MGRLSSFIYLALLVGIVTSQCNLEKAGPHFQRSVYDFSYKLVQRIAQETDNHFVSSPLSIWSLIAFLSLAADGSTLTEIQQVLRLHSHKCFNQRFYELVQMSTNGTKDVVIERSSSLFIDKALLLKEDFVKKVSEEGLAEINSLPFDNFVLAAGAINDYVNQNTHGSINEVVSPSDIENAFLFLIDTLYFKGTWETRFDANKTSKKVFYDESGNVAGEVSFMFAEENFVTAYSDTLRAQVLELPYGTNKRFSMLIFLPYPDVSTASVLDSFTNMNLYSILGLLKENEPRNIAVHIPRFQITSTLDNLKELLIDMGLKSMFDDQRAQFPYLSALQLYISSVLQKAYVSVNEEGTTASAASGISFGTRSGIQKFVANKPFVFMIVNKEKVVPLFIGSYSKPSEY